jgi:hypothetical protein
MRFPGLRFRLMMTRRWLRLRLRRRRPEHYASASWGLQHYFDETLPPEDR